MYHNIGADKYSNDVGIFKKHLHYISKNFNIVVPDEPLSGKDICLTFDDGFYNFYHYVFPLLQEFDIKVLLAVPTMYILDDTTRSAHQRLSIKHDDTYNNIDKAPFCTFKELKQMHDSGLVKIASHAHSHVDLTQCEDLDKELAYSKELLETKLHTTIDTLVFPYGKYDAHVLKHAKKQYRYLFRIGNGINKDFQGIKDVIYRINADGLKDEKEIFSKTNIFKYSLKSFIKSR